MARRLAKLADELDPSKVFFLSAERAEYGLRQLRRFAGSEREPELRLTLAEELICCNRVEEALAELDRLEAEVGKGQRPIRALRALAWLRIGEIENCLERHGCTSCLLPIEQGAVHVKRRGSEHAIPILLDLLEEDPQDLRSLWLLNVAHMTLGTWPDEVPARFLVPPEAFASEIEFPRFRNVAVECGVAWCTLAGGVVAEDLDGDGALDLALTSFGARDPMRLLRNRGDGTFEDRTADAGLEGLTGGLNLIHGDYDNDGDADLFVLRGAWLGREGCIPNSLLRNRGDGAFDDVTREAGVWAEHPTQTAVFTDLDGDGWLDLVVGNETNRASGKQPCEVWWNRQDGTFADVTAATGVEILDFVKAVVAGDVDNDGRVDLFFSVRSGPNVLLRNKPAQGEPGFRFVDVRNTARVTSPRNAFPSFFFDYDNDGWLDLYVATNSGFFGDRTEDIALLYLGKETDSERPCLFRNRGNGRFEEVAAALGADRAIFSMGANYGDLDNDGWLDFYLGTGSPDLTAILPNRMFRNDRGQRFQDVTSAGGFGHLQKGHGIAFADLDNDGDQDVFAHMGGGFTGDVYPAALFENPGFGNRWVGLKLRGGAGQGEGERGANRSGIGARIQVRVVEAGAERTIHHVASTGGSFGASPSRQQIGLGRAERIASLEIEWPGSGTKQSFEDVPLDRFLEIREGSADIRVLELASFPLGGEPKEDGAAAAGDR